MSKLGFVLMLTLVVALVAVGAAPAGAAEPTVQLAQDAKLGSILVDSKGMTLYLFTKDAPGQSNCAGGCAKAWPPLTVADGTAPTAASGLTGALTTLKRADGTTQVAYNGWPLYYWQKDTQPGDTTGQGVGNVWYVLGPEAPTVSVWTDPKLGNLLVDHKGMTLYLYTKDTPGQSNCSGGCAKAWPPLMATAGITPTASFGITGTLSTVKRDDGSLQVAFNGWPLYYWQKDTKPGDTTGQGVGGVWFVVGPTAPTVMAWTDPKLGNILVDSKGMTLYMFKNDAPSKSNCADACAKAWPPLTVAEGIAPTAASGLTGKLATIERADGTYQVTWDGWPLYYWQADQKPGDATGQGVKDVWFVLPAK